MENKKNLTYGFVALLAFGILLGLDQWTKYLSVRYLKGSAGIVLIPDVLELQYLENTGAAWGILAGKQQFLYLLSIPLSLFIIWVFFKTPKTRRYLWLSVTEVMLLAGAVGNLIDRIRLNYVVDFIYFKLIDFPVFNVADIYVVVSVALFSALIVFYYKDEELQFLNRRKDKV